MATKKVILKEIVDDVAGDSLYPRTSIDQVEGLEDALDAAGSVSTISVNSGTPLQPDSNKNINITIPEDLVDLNEDSTHQTVTAAQKTEWNNKSTFSGNYNDLTNKPTIPAAVTESTVSGWGFTKNTGTYSKPSGGIPSTDFTSAVQTSLGKADTAIQSVAVGTTTTGAAGTNASVTNTGTATDPVLSFTIPQGAQGIQGIQGPQGERGPQGNTGVQVDSVASIIHSIDPTVTYATADVAGADAVQDVLSELTELAGNVNDIGVFDISSYNLTNGNPTPYANLTEAIGSNGANVPENKRKGGMSVKYIQLTEATYNITKTEGIETQPTGTEIQEAISIADGDYSESDLSSIETLPTTLGSKVVYYLAVTEEIEVEPETEGGEPTIETVTTYTTWVIIKLSNESTEYVQWMLKSTAWSIVPSNWASEEDVPKESSLSTVTSGGFYNLYAHKITVFERNVKNWAQNIPVILYPGIKYTIAISKASSSLTVFNVKDYNGSGTNLINNVLLANRTIEYTPVNYIVSISLYSANVTANFKIQCDNDKKTLLTHSDVVNNMSDGGTKVPLSAEMGKELNDKTFFLNYYYHPVSSGLFSDGNSAHGNNINYCKAILKNQDIASLSVKDGYEYRIYGKPDNIRSSERFTNITSNYIRDRWVNTSSVGYLWILIRKTDSSVIDCNELSNILIVEYNGAKTQFNKIYTQDDVYRLGRREDLTVDYVNGSISIDYGTRTVDETSTTFISDYIDVSKIAALSFVVSSKYSSTAFSPSLPILWYDSNKNYIGHTNIQILIKDRKAIIGVPDAASYAVFSGKRTVEAIYRQDAIEAHYSISYKSVLGKLKKVSLIICHGQSLMIGADTTSSTVFPKRKRYPSLLTFSFTSGTEPQTQDNKYVGFATLETFYDRESPRLGLGEMFIQTIAKENTISVEANEWENHLMLMPSPARGGASIETLSSDAEYANVEAFIRNAKRFCDEYGYELDAPAWIWFQGENNLGSQTAKDTYKNALLALHERICGSLSTIAGITTRPKCIIYQPSSQCIQSTQAADYGFSNGKLGVPTAFAELLAENDEFLAAAPTYILTPATSGGIYIHCDAESYNLLGAYAGYALKKYLIDGINVKGVVPLNFTVNGNTIKIKYNVPSPPLCVDTNWVREVEHYGYTCVKSDDTDIVTNVSVYWDTVTITCSESPVGCKLRYGLNGDRVYSADGYYGWSGRIYGGRGNIRDNQGNAVCKEMPNGKIYPMYNWAYCFEKLLE